MPRARFLSVRIATTLALVTLLGGVASSCRQTTEAPRELTRAEVEPVLVQYADIAWASYSDSVTRAKDLERAVGAFVDAPSEDSLKSARDAWVEARLPYLQTEVYRFYGGPIDEVELLVNTWPLDEEYLETSDGKAGVVRDAIKYPALSEALLAELNLKEGETSVSTGFHAIEFLLWGKDTSTEGPGTRSFTDYVSEPAPTTLASDLRQPPGAEATVARRRGEYLKLASALLVRHLSQVAAAWRPNVANNYRSRFVELEPRAGLLSLVKGAGSLSGAELSGERLTVPYETRDQENEHSCFSDTTHIDLEYDAIGIRNVLLGRYRRLDGTELRGKSVHDLVKVSDPALAAKLERAANEGVLAARAIPVPFDRAIAGADDTPGRLGVKRAIVAFQNLTTTLDAVAANLGLAASRPETP
jgi:putative iron-regulated protein